MSSPTIHYTVSTILLFKNQKPCPYRFFSGGEAQSHLRFINWLHGNQLREVPPFLCKSILARFTTVVNINCICSHFMFINNKISRHTFVPGLYTDNTCRPGRGRRRGRTCSPCHYMKDHPSFCIWRPRSASRWGLSRGQTFTLNWILPITFYTLSVLPGSGLQPKSAARFFLEKSTIAALFFYI